MDLKFNATIELKPADVQKIIEEAVGAQMKGFTIKSVTFDAGLQHDQFDRGPGMPVFRGAKVTVVPRGTQF